MEHALFRLTGLRRAIASVLCAVLALSLLCTGCGSAGRFRGAAVRMADFLLSLQLENGAIPDAADADTVNEDSNMEYALIALAAAYQNTGAQKYLDGLQRGIAWLAAAQEMADNAWRGSWRYSYRRDGSAAKVGADDAAEIRGVDATSALFVFLLYLCRECSGSSAAIDPYRENARAALDFLLNKSRTASGFFASAFLQNEAGAWERADICYCADQGDVWLGLRAGALLYADDACARAADFLEAQTPAAFFSADRGRYCTGIENGRQDWSAAGFAPLQCQGFLPWLWGDTLPNRAAVTWLQGQLDGDLSQAYFLGGAFLLLGECGIGAPRSDRIAAWLVRDGIDRRGAVSDSPQDETKTVNVAAFCALSLFAWRPFA